MAESKTQGRRSGTAKGTVKPGKEAAKRTRAAGKKTAKAPAKETAAGAAKAPAAKAPAAKAPVKRARSPAKIPKAPAKGAASARPAAPKPATAKAAAPRAPARRKVVQDTARSYYDAVGGRDAAAVAAHWHREGIYDSVPLGVFRGPDAVRRLYQELFAAMPDMRTTVERITADDRVAAVQWRASGSFTGGAFQGIEPTGRRVEVRGVDCLEVDDGKVVRNTSVYDGAAVARGMGLLPPEHSGADRAIRAGLNTVTKLRRAMAARSEGRR